MHTYKHAYIAACLCFILAQSALGQNLQEIWRKTFDGPGHGVDSPLGVVADKNGDLFVSGTVAPTSNSSDPAIGRLAKYAGTDGKILWEVTPGATACYLALDPQGNVVVAGNTAGATPLYVAKYNGATGAQLWQVSVTSAIGAGRPRSVAGMAVDASGRVSVTASTDQELLYDDFSGQTYFEQDLYTVSLSGTNGALLWEQRHTGSAGDIDASRGLVLDPAGNVVVTGNSIETAGSGRYVAKYDAATGAILWEIKSADKAIGMDVATDASGAVFVTGQMETAKFNRDLYVTKYDGATGARQWEKIYTNTLAEPRQGRCLKVSPAGEVYVFGEGGYELITGEYVFSTYMAKLANADGAVIWETLVPKKLSNGDDGAGLELLADGRLALARAITSTVEGDKFNPSLDLYVGVFSGSTGALEFEASYDGAPWYTASDYAASFQPLAPTPDGGFVYLGNVTIVPGSGRNDDWMLIKYAAKNASPAFTFTTKDFPIKGGNIVATGGSGSLSYGVVGSNGVLTTALPTGQKLLSTGAVTGTAKPGNYTVTIRVTETGGQKRSVDKTFTFTVADNSKPLTIQVRQRDGAQIVQGGLVSYEWTVTNISSITAKNISFEIEPPKGLVLLDGVEGPKFVGADGQPSGAPIDPVTKKQVRIEGSTSNPRLQNNPDGTQTATFQIGSMLKGGTQKLRATFRIAYDYPIGPVLEFDQARARCPINSTRFFEAKMPLVQLQVSPAEIGRNRPSLTLTTTQLGAGWDNEKPGIALVTNAAGSVSESLPKRTSNEIVYRATVTNIGPVGAAFTRISLPLPPHTTYKPNSAMEITANKRVKLPAAAVIPNTKLKSTTVVLSVPRLEANGPGAPGSQRTVEIIATVKTGTPVNTSITQPGGTASSLDLYRSVSTFTPLLARVERPSAMVYSETRTPDRGASPAGEVRHILVYQNAGGFPARDVDMTYTIPPGLNFKSASFRAGLFGPVDRRAGRTMTTPADPANGTVHFKIKTVPARQAGVVEVVLGLNSATLPQSGPEAFRSIAAFEHSDRDHPLRRTTREPAAADLGDISGNILVQPAADPTLGRTFIMQTGPALARRGDTITYLLAYGSVSDVGTGVGAAYFPTPMGTEFVSASNATEIASGFVDDFTYLPPGTPIQSGRFVLANGGVNWVGGTQGHSARLATVTVKVLSNAPEIIETTGVLLSGDLSGYCYGANVRTRILNAGTLIDDKVRASTVAAAAGNASAAAFGFADVPGQTFANEVVAINDQTPFISIAGADSAEVAGNGAVIVPLGLGRMVAAGGGNLVAAGGGNVVPTGAGRLVAAGGGNLVAAGGGNLVAAGGGNLVTVQVPGSGAMAANAIIKSSYSLVAAGGMNLRAALGGNLLVKGLIGNDGSTLIGLDGSTLVGNDGASLGAFAIGPKGVTFTAVDGAVLNLPARIASMVAAGGGNMVAAGGGNLVAAGSLNLLPLATLIGNDGSTVVGDIGSGLKNFKNGKLVGNDGASLVGNDGASLIGLDGSTLVGNDGASLIGNDGSTLTSVTGGSISAVTNGLLPDKSAGVISDYGLGAQR